MTPGSNSSDTGPSPQRARADCCAAEHSQTNTAAALDTRRCPNRSRRRHRGDPPATRIDVRHTRRAMAGRLRCCPRQEPAPVHTRSALHGRRLVLRDFGAGRSGVSDLPRSDARTSPSLHRSELRQRSSPRLHSTRLARPRRTRLTPPGRRRQQRSTRDATRIVDRSRGTQRLRLRPPLPPRLESPVKRLGRLDG